PFRLHNRDALIDLLIGQVQTEFATQHVPEFALARKPTLLRVPLRVADGNTRIVHGDPTPIRSRLRYDDVALVRRLRMGRRVPVSDLVFAIIARVRNDAVNVLPAILEPDRKS